MAFELQSCTAEYEIIKLEQMRRSVDFNSKLEEWEKRRNTLNRNTTDLDLWPVIFISGIGAITVIYVWQHHTAHSAAMRKKKRKINIKYKIEFARTYIHIAWIFLMNFVCVILQLAD